MIGNVNQLLNIYQTYIQLDDQLENQIPGRIRDYLVDHLGGQHDQLLIQINEQLWDYLDQNDEPRK